MENQEWGEYQPQESDQERISRESRESEEKQAAFLAREREEQDRRLQPTLAERDRWKKEDAAKEAREAEAARFRLTPEEQAEQQARQEAEDQRRREEKSRREEFLNSPQHQAQLEAERQARWAKISKEERQQAEFAEIAFEKMKQEKAPRDKVDALVKERLRLRLDEETVVDLTEALPALLQELSKNPEAVHAARGLEDLRKNLDKVVENALMYSSDYQDYLEKATKEFQDKVFSEARRYGVDLAKLPKAAAVEAPEAKPGDALEAALLAAGLDKGAYERLLPQLPDGGMISERKMLEGQYRMVREAIGKDAEKKNPYLKATIDQFIQDLKRGLERHGGK